MIELILASLIWAFSFGLIKTQLSGLNPLGTATVRLVLSFLIFLPFLFTYPRGTARRNPAGAFRVRQILSWMGIGAIQFGLMYCLYMKSFEYLQAHEVAVLTITTPLLVVLLNACIEQSLRLKHLLAAILAISAGLVLMLKHSWSNTLAIGVVLIQASNLFFAAGQLLYRRSVPTNSSDHHHFAWLYLGAALMPLLGLALQGQMDPSVFHYSSAQLWTLLYLGILPTGFGFFLWNRGAKRVNPGSLAVMNNLKIPLGALVAWGVFHETVNFPRLSLSMILFASALWISKTEHSSS